MRWIVHGVLFVALAVGIFGVLPRLGGLTRDAAGLLGVLAIIVGIIALVWPGVTVLALVILFGLVSVAFGVVLFARPRTGKTLDEVQDHGPEPAPTRAARPSGR